MQEILNDIHDDYYKKYDALTKEQRIPSGYHLPGRNCEVYLIFNRLRRSKRLRWNTEEYLKRVSSRLLWRCAERLSHGRAPRSEERTRDGRGYSRADPKVKEQSILSLNRTISETRPTLYAPDQGRRSTTKPRGKPIFSLSIQLGSG